ncbi:MAG: hypothetical protein GWN07_41585, partial [Actinobacteria bacterium]|nr:hypothetical protein [Actinomycetota bacterium]NIS37532.1 hypothetical protein [Actinomycetota bacterium]NIU71941.1 hypothetical protein [Actinomycetota bacterium]NIW33876.1 hypothetical protein [Actinomycetota bacterium]NIX25966.1 hypothetical protein [Actinomycetota bacterium]
GLAECEHRTPRISFESELSRSLEVRRHYTRLRATIGAGELELAELSGWMRRVGTAFAVLIGQDVYPDLRVDDRRQLRTLQHRLLDWLRSDPADPSSTQEGVRLRQDIIGFGQMLGAVRNRQELIEHDAIVLGELLESEGATEDAIARLRLLEG